MRSHNFFAFLKGILFIQIFLIIIIAGLSLDINRKYMEGMEFLSLERVFLPFSGMQITERQAELLLQENNVLLTGVKNIPNKFLEDEYNAATIPEDLIGSHIQALAFTERGGDQTVIDPEEDVMPTDRGTEDMEEINQSAPLDSETLARFQKSKVFLYCTHSAETYIPNSGQARLDGKRGLVNQVAATIENSLNTTGLPAQFIDTLHDYPDYNKSYTKSRTTVSKIVGANKNILGLFDIHRDSIPGEGKASTIKINGKKCARILIVVGTNERKPHPNWQQNHNFAEKIYRQGEKMYPGLIKGVMTKSGTYHQEFNPRALLLEFGTDHNTLDEVTQSAKLFSEILIEVTKEAK
ncbi:MAG: stage II sporulation protein P [Syntrophomonas sp.]|jgi:stage II sporulation protein P|nr:stage II sporulation protein P [Syntrophomonas sp.]